jgi:hypothetical protein
LQGGGSAPSDSGATSSGQWTVLDGEASPWQFAALRLRVFFLSNNAFNRQVSHLERRAKFPGEIYFYKSWKPRTLLLFSRTLYYLFAFDLLLPLLPFYSTHTHTFTMATTLPTTNGKHDGANGTDGVASFAVKAGLARMLKGGVIMDVVNAEQVRSFSGSSL